MAVAQVAAELPGFRRLAMGISLYDPLASGADGQKQGDIRLVILCTWMAAFPKHIAKYTEEYKKLFPSAKILVIQSEMSDVFWHSHAFQAARFSVARRVIRETLRDTGDTILTAPKERHILLHVFSNGGSLTATQLLRQLWSEINSPLPLRAMYMDSTPSRANVTRSVRAFKAALPRTLFLRAIGTFLIYCGIVPIFIFYRFFRKEYITEKLRRDLVDAKLFSKDVPRAYLFSDADEMVNHVDVNDHAVEAKAWGYNVHNVEFTKSPHVAHAMMYKDRYWKAITDLARS